MENFTPWLSLSGGLLIGLSATMMLLLLGRVAGISGIVAGFISGERTDLAWRGAFVGGLLLGGVVAADLKPEAVTMTLDRSWWALALAGLLVGFGSRLGSGCTSGHGVCGMARASRRSIVATITFMTTGVATACLVAAVFGGSL